MGSSVLLTGIVVTREGVHMSKKHASESNPSSSASYREPDVAEASAKGQ
jgi:hypothetical protein